MIFFKRKVTKTQTKIDQVKYWEDMGKYLASFIKSNENTLEQPEKSLPTCYHYRDKIHSLHKISFQRSLNNKITNESINDINSLTSKVSHSLNELKQSNLKLLSNIRRLEKKN